MRRIRTTTIQAVIGATVIAGAMAAVTPAAQAATPVPCSETALVAAVNHANSIGGDTLLLSPGCIYTMTSPHGGAANALPVITTRIAMIGPATITRASPLLFRIAEVSKTGSLTLTTGVALTHGSVVGNGGAILNQGAVTLTGSSLTGNTATGNGGGLANAKTLPGTAPAAATFTDSPVSNNTAGHNGGGLANDGTPAAPGTGPGPAATFTRSLVSNNTAQLGYGGGIYNGLRDTLTTTGVSGSPLFITGNTAGLKGGGIAAINSTTTLTQTAVTVNHAGITAGGVYRQGGTMTTTSTPITANTPNNCVGSAPAVPNCTA